MQALGINLGFFLVQLLNFTIVMIVLLTWGYRPILKALEARKQKIAQAQEDARVAAEARANAEAEAAKVLADAQAEANRRVAEAVARAEEAATAVVARAELERVSRIKSAQADAEQERDRMLGEMRGQIVSLAIAAANKIIAETLDERRQHALVEEFFSGVRAGKVVVLADAAVSGAAATVTSALPLTPDEQAAVKQDIVARLGGAPTVVFKVNPAILGGLIVRVGDKIIDGSVANQLGQLSTSLR